jgi:hypothetical protein
MADLLDIVPATAVETISTTGGDVTVRGLRAPAIASIVSRFPNCLALFASGGNLDMLAQTGAAVPAIIAAGCDHLADEKYEKAAADLALEDQLRLIGAVMRLTFPNGLSSFVEAMATLFPKVDGEGAKPIKVRLKKSSPSPSPGSSDADSLPTTQ